MLSDQTRPGFVPPLSRLASRLAVLWLAFALVCQGLVVQTHAHIGGVERAMPAAASIASARVDPGLAAWRKQAPATPTCPLCEERAMFGAYLLSGSVAIVAPAAGGGLADQPILSSLALPAGFAPWHSRAPPSSAT